MDITYYRIIRQNDQWVRFAKNGIKMYNRLAKAIRIEEVERIV